MFRFVRLRRAVFGVLKDSPVRGNFWGVPYLVGGAGGVQVCSDLFRFVQPGQGVFGGVARRELLALAPAMPPSGSCRRSPCRGTRCTVRPSWAESTSHSRWSASSSSSCRSATCRSRGVGDNSVAPFWSSTCQNDSSPHRPRRSRSPAQACGSLEPRRHLAALDQVDLNRLRSLCARVGKMSRGSSQWFRRVSNKWENWGDSVDKLDISVNALRVTRLVCVALGRACAQRLT